MKGPRRAVPRLRTRGLTVHHGGGSQSRVMQSTKQATPRVEVTVRVTVHDVDGGERARLTVGELEAVIQAITEAAHAYELVSRERAAGPVGPSRPPPPKTG